jgi:hypothetical protein
VRNAYYRLRPYIRPYASAAVITNSPAFCRLIPPPGTTFTLVGVPDQTDSHSQTADAVFHLIEKDRPWSTQADTSAHELNSDEGVELFDDGAFVLQRLDAKQ